MRDGMRTPGSALLPVRSPGGRGDSLLDARVPTPFPRPVPDQLAWATACGDLVPPSPGRGATPERWSTLARWGRTDLAFARLAEGHVDALAILEEAGTPVRPGARYGVWAAIGRAVTAGHRPTSARGSGAS